MNAPEQEIPTLNVRFNFLLGLFAVITFCYSCLVPILGHVLAMTDNPNPECSDLGKLTKTLENAIAKVPKSKVDCKTNANCTGKIKSISNNQIKSMKKTLFKHGKIYSNLQIFIKLQLEKSTDELQST